MRKRVISFVTSRPSLPKENLTCHKPNQPHLSEPPFMDGADSTVGDDFGGMDWLNTLSL